jgi:phenylalanyl-tRNA synthetase beta chain
MPLGKAEGGSMVLEVSPNRPDWLSVEGIARSLSSFLSAKAGIRPLELAKPAVECRVEKEFLAARPFVGAAVARKARLTDESVRQMMQLEEKLCETVGRKRRKISMGHYDLSKLEPPFYYKGAKPGEVSFVPLGMEEKLPLSQIIERHPKGQQYARVLDGLARYPVILDSEGEALCLIPITNGESSRVTTKTADVFVEVNGTTRQAVDSCLAILCAQLADRGAKMEQVMFSGAFSGLTPSFCPRAMKTSQAAAGKLLGVEMPATDIAKNLEKMGYGAIARGESVEAAIPYYRADIMHECDLIEDAGIAYGFEKFRGRPSPFVTTGARHPVEAFADRLRGLMVGFGFQDCVTFTLTNERTHYEKMLSKPAARVEIGNPLTSETTMVRTSILPSLLSVLEANTREKYPQLLFEAGDVAVIDKDDPNGCRTQKKLCALIASREAGLSEIKSVLESALAELGSNYEFEKGQEDFFIPTRSAKVSGEKVRGCYGEIHPQVLENFGIEMPVAAFEIWFEND